MIVILFSSSCCFFPLVPFPHVEGGDQETISSSSKSGGGCLFFSSFFFLNLLPRTNQTSRGLRRQDESTRPLSARSPATLVVS